MKLFDAHFHIIDPRFPLVPNQGYVPEAFSLEDYRVRMAGFEVLGGAVVSASFQGFDQTYLVEALRQLGTGFVGVAQLPVTVSDEEIAELHQAGVRAVRFNLYRGASVQLDELAQMAQRVFAVVGWHAELYVDSRDLPELMPHLRILPRLCIDHLGMSQDGLGTLLQLVERGACVKATGFGRVNSNLDIPSTLRAIHAANPAALLFASDLPGTRARRPFYDSDITLIVEALGEPASQRVLFENALALYRRVV